VLSVLFRLCLSRRIEPVVFVSVVHLLEWMRGRMISAISGCRLKSMLRESRVCSGHHFADGDQDDHLETRTLAVLTLRGQPPYP